jgi:hypothetical protein
MSKEFEVYLPVAVTVVVEDDGTITTGLGRVDYDGSPFARTDSIWSVDEDEWRHPTYAESNGLDAVEDAACEAVADAFRLVEASWESVNGQCPACGTGLDNVDAGCPNCGKAMG